MTEKTQCIGSFLADFLPRFHPCLEGNFVPVFCPPFAVRSCEAINERDEQPLVSQQNQLVLRRAAMSIIGLPHDMGAPGQWVSGVPSQTVSIEQPPMHCPEYSRRLVSARH